MQWLIILITFYQNKLWDGLKIMPILYFTRVRGSQMEGSCSGTGTVAGFGICGNELSSS